MRVRHHLAEHGVRPIEIVGGEGCELVGADGKRYLDLLAGWCVGNVGWKRPEVLEAMRAWTEERGFYVPPVFAYKEWEEFAATLVGRAPGGRVSRAFRCTSGSEAVEFAIKCARAATGKPTVVSVAHVYHGHTYGAAAVGNACREEMGPCPAGFEKIPMPHPRYGTDPDLAVDAFERLVAGRDDIAAFLTEPVWSNAGVIVPEATFLPRIQRICRDRGILFVMDEVATGFGRCGALFASELAGLEPDIVCLGKGLTGGYATMGATLVTEPVYEASRRLPTYSTFGWAPADLAAARANVEVILKERLWENAAAVGRELLAALAPLADLPFVGEVRGAGLLIGIEIVRDKRSMAPDLRRAWSLQDAIADAGAIVETAGHVLFLSPPLTLTSAQARAGAEMIARALRAA